MVKGIELLLGHQAQQVRKLESGHTIGFEQGRETAQKIVDIRHVGEHVVGGHQVSRPTFARQVMGGLFAEEHLTNLQPFLPGRLCSASGGFDTEARNAALGHILQQVTVVGGDFHHPALAVQAETLDHLPDIVAGMGQPRTGIGAEIRIVGIEQRLGAGVILGLHQPALLTHRHFERHPGLGCCQLVSAQVGVGRRRSAKVDQGQAQAGTTATAVHGRTPVNDRSSQG
ncbi:hypothetical protein D3C81_1143440 [compost metagenome]